MGAAGWKTIARNNSSSSLGPFSISQRVAGDGDAITLSSSPRRSGKSRRLEEHTEQVCANSGSRKSRPVTTLSLNQVLCDHISSHCARLDTCEPQHPITCALTYKSL